MGLFDKIKDNAKSISVRSIEEVQQDALMVAPESDLVVQEPANVEIPEEPAITNKAANSDADTVDETEPVSTNKSQTTAPSEKEDVVKPKPEVVPKEAAKVPEESKEPEQKKKESATPKQVKVESPKSAPASSTSTNYTPHYKSKPTEKQPDEHKPTPLASVPKQKVIDVTPHKPVDNVKQAIYARERATLALLANQRRMNGAIPLYATNHLRFKTRVFIDRIEYSGSFGKNVLPIERVAWVKLRAGGTGVIIETTDGKRVVMVVKPADRLDFADAVMKVQTLQPKREKFKDTKTVRLDQLEQFGEGIDELEKLAKLYEKGILTKEEFETKKKQILNI